MRDRIITALATILAIPAMAAPAGYFQVPGTETTMRVYGKAETWGAYGFNGLTDVTADPAGLNGDQSWNRSGEVDSWTLARIGVQTTTPSAFGDVTTRVEYQAKSGANNASLNLRHAYGEFAGLLIGQTDSLFMAWHNTPTYYDVMLTDFNGTSRLRQIRYTFAPAEGWKVGFSMEQDKTPGNSTRLAPALVGAVQYSADWGGVVASVGYQRADEWSTTASESGTGVSFALSAAFNINDNNTLQASIINGGNYYGFGQWDDTYGDGFYLDGTDIKFYKTLAWNLSFSHTWNDAFQSNIAVGQVYWKKKTGLIPEKITLTELMLNTTWKVTKNALFGAEFLMDQVKEKDGFVNKNLDIKDKVTDSTFKLFFRYNFF